MKQCYSSSTGADAREKSDSPTFILRFLLGVTLSHIVLVQ